MADNHGKHLSIGQDTAFPLGPVGEMEPGARKAAASARVAFFSNTLAKHQAAAREPSEPPARVDPFEKGARVFFRHPEQGWVLGTVHRVHQARGTDKLYSVIPGEVELGEDGEEVVLSAAKTKELVRLKKDDMTAIFTKAQLPVQDLMKVTQLHESVILHQLRTAYERGDTYLHLGPNICLSLNPGKQNPDLTSPEMLRRFLDARGPHQSGLPPHVWGTARQMFWHCLSQSPAETYSQAMLFTGMSGSGKTESCKLALQYLVKASIGQANIGAPRAQSERMGAMLLTASQVLDVFGNASVHRFTNSSRMTKCVELFITPGGALLGGRFRVSMLERSRVTTPPEGERGFHIFYALLAGIDATTRRRLGLEDSTRYDWLFRNLVVTDEDDTQDAEAYKYTRAILTDIGFAAFELDAIDSILAGIIHLRGIELISPSSVRRNSVEWTESMEETVRLTASLWGIEPHTLFGEVASVTTAGRSGGATTRRLRPAQADIARNNVCKSVYLALVEWLVSRINREVFRAVEEQTELGRSKVLGIALLDLFGSETDKKRGNMIEQLLMNTAAEEIQQSYNRNVFEDEVEECLAEGLDMDGLVPPDTTHTIELMTGLPKGLFAILDEQSKQSGSSGIDSGFIGQLGLHHKDHPSLVFDATGAFGVNHYSGIVRYGPTNNWSTLNMEVTKSSLLHSFRESTNDIVRALFDCDGSLVQGTLCRQYQDSMEDLRAILHGKQLNWCRCFRPDYSFCGFSGSLVLSQLVHEGVVETIKVRRNCYPVRLPHDYFLGRYKNVIRGSSYDEGEGNVTIGAILKFANIHKATDSQVGKSKVFLKDGAHTRLEDLRQEVTSPSKLVTGFIAAKLTQRATAARSATQDAGDSPRLSPRLSPKPAKPGVSLVAAQQSMRILAAHLPVFLAFARGALAVLQVQAMLQPEIDENAVSEHQIISGGTEVPDPCDETTSYLDKGIFAVSAPLRKLAEWKRSSRRTIVTPLEPPPPPINLETDSPPRHPDDISGKLCRPESYALPSPDLDQGDTDFNEPNVENHDYQAIILKEAHTLNKMPSEELFDCLGQGRREVRASLRLSKESVSAIKRIVSQGLLHERHCKRALLNRERDEQERAEREGTATGAKKHRGKGFPNSLGPFSLFPCGNIVTQVREGRYTVPLEGPLEPLVGVGMPNEGRVSPQSAVTLPQALRRKAMIPRMAASFVWAYPLPGMNGLRGLPIDQTSHIVQFVTFGGFIYLDARGMPLSVNALCPGEGLSFVGPHKWSTTIETTEMERSGRMQPITIKALADTGARYFCWIKPNEDIGLKPVPVHGGFVYLFREPSDEPCPDDRYFIIGSDDKKHLASDTAGSTPFRDTAQEERGDDVVEIPRIEGVKELEGVVVHKRVYAAINEVIESDMAVQRVRVGLEPLNASSRVTLMKQRDNVPHNDPSILSPVRHHLRRPEEFVDVEGGYLGWNQHGVQKPCLELDYSGENGFPFPNGITTQLSPLRSRPFFIHSMPANHRTAFGKSVDGKLIPQEVQHGGGADGGTQPRSYWLDLYNKGRCGGAKMDLHQDRAHRSTASLPHTADPSTVKVAFGVYGKHAGRVHEGSTTEESEDRDRATRYLETIKYELDRQR